MSEVLRAVFDKNCIDSRSAFYCAQVVVQIGTAGAYIGRRQASIACKTDTWFLCMAAAFDGFFVPTVGTNNAWFTKANPSTFQIRRASTGEAFSISPQLQVLQNYNLNNLVTLDEYIPFPPRELIMVDADVPINLAAAGIGYYFLTLLGVEYQMPT